MRLRIQGTLLLYGIPSLPFFPSLSLSLFEVLSADGATDFAEADTLPRTADSGGYFVFRLRALCERLMEKM